MKPISIIFFYFLSSAGFCQEALSEKSELKDGQELVNNFTKALKAQRSSLLLKSTLQKPEGELYVKFLWDGLEGIEEHYESIEQVYEENDAQRISDQSEISESFYSILTLGNKNGLFWESLELIDFEIETVATKLTMPGIQYSNILITYGIAESDMKLKIELGQCLKVADRWHVSQKMEWLGFNPALTEEELEVQSFKKREAETYPLLGIKPKSERPSEELMMNAIKLFDQSLSQESIAEQVNFNQSFSEDEILMNLFHLVDSLTAIGSMGLMDTAIYATARQLDNIPSGYFNLSQRFLELNKYNESAFLLSVGAIRAYQDKSTSKSELQELSFLLNPEMGGNWYMMADLKNWVNVMYKAIDFCRVQDIAAYPQYEDALNTYYNRPVQPLHNLIDKNEGGEQNQSYNWSHKLRPRTEERVNR